MADSVLRRFVFSTLQADTVQLTAHEDGGEKVIQLVVSNESFRFTAGQYAELKVPEISKSEWHPFTIAGAPNLAGGVTFYIKAVGKWTNAMYEIALKSTPSNPALVQIGIRGPYGAPAQDYFDYKHIVVIGSGIGVTPLLSIWKHLVNNGRNRVVATDSDLLPKSGAPKDARLRRLPVEMEEKRLTEETNVNYIGVTNFDRPLVSRRAKIAYYACVLESMTFNICLLVFSLCMETIIFCVWLFGFDMEAASIQLSISTLTLLIFGSKMILSCLAYGRRYTRSLVFLLEGGIILLDGVAVATSVAAIHSPSRAETISYFTFYVAFIILHAIRIFHVCYATARPPVISRIENDKGMLHSVTGIWVSRKYASMSFAVSDLVDTVSGLPKAFSLQLFATRDKPVDAEKNNPFAKNEPNHCLHAGRPDWDTIMHAEMDRAHGTNPEGETVGVFFCGSPAIAATLQVTAHRVTAEHKYTHDNCNCRLMVHKENF